MRPLRPAIPPGTVWGLQPYGIVWPVDSMAINTAAKRKSLSGILGYVCGPGVTPAAAHTLAWRQQVGYGYSGIAIITPEGGSLNVVLWLQYTAQDEELWHC